MGFIRARFWVRCRLALAGVHFRSLKLYKNQAPWMAERFFGLMVTLLLLFIDVFIVICLLLFLFSLFCSRVWWNFCLVRFRSFELPLARAQLPAAQRLQVSDATCVALASLLWHQAEACEDDRFRLRDVWDIGKKHECLADQRLLVYDQKYV